MAEVRLTKRVPFSAKQTWQVVSDLSRLGEWLSLHEAWRSDVPAELAVGTELTGVVRAKGVRNKITWVVDELIPEQLLAMSGAGVGGTKVSMSLGLAPAGSGTELSFRTDFAHPALRGPLGGLTARAMKGDLEASLDRLAKLL